MRAFGLYSGKTVFLALAEHQFGKCKEEVVIHGLWIFLPLFKLDFHRSSFVWPYCKMPEA